MRDDLVLIYLITALAPVVTTTYAFTAINLTISVALSAAGHP